MGYFGGDSNAGEWNGCVSSKWAILFFYATRRTKGSSLFASGWADACRFQDNRGGSKSTCIPLGHIKTNKKQ